MKRRADKKQICEIAHGRQARQPNAHLDATLMLALERSQNNAHRIRLVLRHSQMIQVRGSWPKTACGIDRDLGESFVWI
jgi:hypothetical protein